MLSRMKFHDKTGKKTNADTLFFKVPAFVAAILKLRP